MLRRFLNWWSKPSAWAMVHEVLYPRLCAGNRDPDDVLAEIERLRVWVKTVDRWWIRHQYRSWLYHYERRAKEEKAEARKDSAIEIALPVFPKP